MVRGAREEFNPQGFANLEEEGLLGRIAQRWRAMDNLWLVAESGEGQGQSETALSPPLMQGEIAARQGQEVTS